MVPTDGSLKVLNSGIDQVEVCRALPRKILETGFAWALDHGTELDWRQHTIRDAQSSRQILERGLVLDDRGSYSDRRS
jgi:hypothetical protein